MNEGVQILLERMKTHPEEFVAEAQYGISKWGQAIQHLQDYLPKEDKETLETAWKQTVSDEMQRRFTQAVMEELVDPKSERGQERFRIGQMGGMQLGGQTHAQQMAIQQAYIAQQKAAIQQAQAAQATNAYLGNSGQQLTSPYSNLVSDGRGYLSSLFGGKK